MKSLLRCTARCTALICGLLIAVSPFAKSDTYQFTPTVVPGSNLTAATALNDDGVVVGWYIATAGGSISGFTDSDGVYQTVNVPGAQDTWITGIGNNGEVAGWYLTDSVHAFVYDGSTFTTIPDVPGAVATWAFGINDSGQVVGNYQVGDIQHGYLYSNGIFTFLDYPGAPYGSNTGTGISGINDSGQIVGAFSCEGVGGNCGAGITYGFLENSGAFTEIDVPGASDTWANSIDDNGTICGTYNQGSNSHGFVDTNGAFTTFDYPGAQSSGVVSCNDSGQILVFASPGSYYLATPYTPPPPPVSEPSGFDLLFAGLILMIVPGLRFRRILTHLA